MRFIFLLLLAFCLGACAKKPTQLQTGIWRAVLEIQGQQLPFNFEVSTNAAGSQVVTIHNAAERLVLDEVNFQGDSINIVLHVFDAYLRGVVKGDSLLGWFNLNYNPTYKVPFKAKFGQNFRFEQHVTNSVTKNFSGKYQVQFYNVKDTVPALAIIEQAGSTATGSFLTPTGDYRYLEGNVVNDTLWLSGFDGNHLYIFNAVKSEDTLSGTHWLGKSRNRKWVGIKNDQATAPVTESLTFLKEGYTTLQFTFPDVNRKPISLQDEHFKNKVVVIQILGSWCPNCMDETRFLTAWYPKNKDRGVEIIGLAYEQKEDFDYASGRVKKLKEKLGIPYDIVIAGTNTNASETLPALNRVIAFPTTIFVGKDGLVKHIHTGFSGPGTGVYYQQQQERFNEIINQLINE
ncbi:MAG: TlpA family protein disulfide reductase [Bacteroidetes bacterium CHB5]|nr:TlpA family protein disulfide reductase [Bacteroidetes bacterium CHB5]